MKGVGGRECGLEFMHNVILLTSKFNKNNCYFLQEDQQKPLNYADLSFDESGKPPPRYGSGTEYSEMSSEKRPPPAGGQGGGGQGEGGFELWC